MDFVFHWSIHRFCISLESIRILKYSHLTLYVHSGYVYTIGLEMLPICMRET